MTALVPHLSVLAGAADGDSRAVRTLLDACVPVVLAWCKRLAGPSIDPCDAAQDVMLVVIDRVHTVESPQKFRAWLFGVTRRVLAKHRRSVWVHRWTGGLLGDAAGTDDPYRDAEMSETARRVHRLMHALSPEFREVLVLCDLEERSDSEVAELLGLPKSTVKSRLRRARAAFRSAASKRGLGPVLASR